MAGRIAERSPVRRTFVEGAESHATAPPGQRVCPQEGSRATGGYRDAIPEGRLCRLRSREKLQFDLRSNFTRDPRSRAARC
jgi:hypothetical protein